MISILAGDVQQGWSVSILSELAERGVGSDVVLYLIRMMETDVVLTLLSGQTNDLTYSKSQIETLDEEMILRMLWKKTGALYELVHSISQFTGRCGTAFQLQDDLLGVTGDAKKLGKEVGSDIREGKRTLIAYHAIVNADAAQKRRLSAILGNESASDEEVREAVGIFRELGSIEYTRSLAERYITEAKDYLKTVPESEYRDLLLMWAEYMVNREF